MFLHLTGLTVCTNKISRVPTHVPDLVDGDWGRSLVVPAVDVGFGPQGRHGHPHVLCPVYILMYRDSSYRVQGLSG